MSEITTEELTEQQASELIAAKISLIEELTAECVEISNRSGVGFSFNPSDGYGMGGWYNPPKKKVADGDEDDDDSWYESGWQSSSSSC